MAYQITYVSKDSRYNPYEQITHIGGMSGGLAQRPWKVSRQSAIRGIESGQWSFQVNRGGQCVDVVVAISQYGKKYLKTRADRHEPEILLSLPEQ